MPKETFNRDGESLSMPRIQIGTKKLLIDGKQYPLSLDHGYKVHAIEEGEPAKVTVTFLAAPTYERDEDLTPTADITVSWGNTEPVLINGQAITGEDLDKLIKTLKKARKQTKPEPSVYVQSPVTGEYVKAHPKYVTYNPADAEFWKAKHAADRQAKSLGLCKRSSA